MYFCITDASGCTGTCEEKFFDIQIHCKEYDDNVTNFETEFDTSGDAVMLCRQVSEINLNSSSFQYFVFNNTNVRYSTKRAENLFFQLNVIILLNEKKQKQL